MTTNRFAKRIIVRIFVYAVVSIIVANIMLNTPVITNNIAMGQMENSNELYLMMETYNKVKHFISIIYGFFTTYVVGVTVYDIFKFISKQNKGEN